MIGRNHKIGVTNIFGDGHLSRAVQRIWDEVDGCWFEFQFHSCRISSSHMGISLGFNSSLEKYPIINEIEIILLMSTENIELKLDGSFSSDNWLRDRIMNGLREKSKLPEGCLAVYESHQIGREVMRRIEKSKIPEGCLAVFESERIG